jgi:hypothetical protein
VTNPIRRNLVAIASATMLAGMVLLAPGEAPANHGRYYQSVCLAVTENGSSVLSLRITHRYMLEPGPNDIRVVKAVVNGAEPAMGLAMRTSRDTVVLNMNGTVAGFFTAMTMNWNTATNTGTGRILGELSVHSGLTINAVSCP